MAVKAATTKTFDTTAKTCVTNLVKQHTNVYVVIGKPASVTCDL